MASRRATRQPVSALYTLNIDQTTFPLRRTLSAIATIVFAVILFRTAWISDDALISFRTVLNVTHGYGLTFNIVERVQTFTHPLWSLGADFVMFGRFLCGRMSAELRRTTH